MLLVESRTIFIPHLYLAPSQGGYPVGISLKCFIFIKPGRLGYRVVKRNYKNILSRFRRIPKRNGQTDRRTELLYQNGTRYGHSYNRRRIGTRMRFIEWCHFQWSLMTPNLDFKVTILSTSDNSKMVQG